MTAHLLLAVLVSLVSINGSVDSNSTIPDQKNLYLIEQASLPQNSNYIFNNDSIALTFSYPENIDSSSIFEIMPEVSGDYYILKIKGSDELRPLSGIIPYMTFGNFAIFRTSSEKAKLLSSYGWGLTKINPVSKSQNGIPNMSLPSITTTDSNIVDMISEITLQSSRQIISDLSGIYSRYSFSPGCRQAEQYVSDRFSEAGLATSFYTFQYSGTDMRDVIGQMTGRVSPESIIIVCGHLDCTSENQYNYAPGAEDNGSGSAIVIEAARALGHYETDLTVRFITFSGEEQGLIGSDRYAQYVQNQGEAIAAVINIDMTAYSGPYSMDMHIFSDPQSYWLGGLAANLISTYSTLDTVSHYEYSPRWGSDHYPFATRGYPSIFFIDAWDGFDWYPYYHTTADTLGNLNMNQEMAIGQAVTALAATLARPHFGPEYILGDANSSGDVDAIDVVYIVNYLKGRGPIPEPIQSGDVNGDCETNGVDVVYLVNYLKGGHVLIQNECN